MASGTAIPTSNPSAKRKKRTAGGRRQASGCAIAKAIADALKTKSKVASIPSKTLTLFGAAKETSTDAARTRNEPDKACLAKLKQLATNPEGKMLNPDSEYMFSPTQHKPTSPTVVLDRWRRFQTLAPGERGLIKSRRLPRVPIDMKVALNVLTPRPRRPKIRCEYSSPLAAALWYQR